MFGNSIFSNQQQQQQQKTGLFGNTSGGLFGSTGQPQQQPQQGQMWGQATNLGATTTGQGIFGQPQQPQTSGGLGGISGGGSLFGQNKPAGATGIFGQTTQQPTMGNVGGTLFGGNVQQQPSTSAIPMGSGTSTLGGTGIFGGGTSSGTGLFGQPQQPQQSIQAGLGIFQQQQPQQVQPTPMGGAGIFGGMGQQPQQPQQGGGLFSSGLGGGLGQGIGHGQTMGMGTQQMGQPIGSQMGTGGFLGTGQQQQQPLGGQLTGTSLFQTSMGQPSTMQQTTMGTSSLFGGQQQQQKPSTGIFGGTGMQQPTQQGGLGVFGTSSTISFGGQPQTGTTTQLPGTYSVQYQPLKAQEQSSINNQQKIENIFIISITGMPQYNTKSIEELRYEDFKNKKQGLVPQLQQSTGLGLGAGLGMQPQQQAQQQPLLGGLGLTSTTSQQQGGIGLFGQTSQAPKTGGLFGGSTSTTTGGTGGIFGGGLGSSSVPQQQQPQSGLFGGATTTSTQPSFGMSTGLGGQTGGGLFQTSTLGQQPLQQQQPQQTTTTGGLFGGGLGGGLSFGQKPATTTTTGQPSTSGGLFMNGGTTTGTGGLFGGGATAGAKPATTTGGLFSQGGGLGGGLGLGTTTQQGGLGLGLGQPSTSTTTTTTSGGLFGQPSTGTSTTGGGLFGASTTTSGLGLGGGQPSTSGGLFGQKPAETGGGLFGTGSSSLTGGNLQATSTGGLFGGLSGGTSSGLGLGGTTTLGTSKTGELFGAPSTTPTQTVATTTPTMFPVQSTDYQNFLLSSFTKPKTITDTLNELQRQYIEQDLFFENLKRKEKPREANLAESKYTHVPVVDEYERPFRYEPATYQYGDKIDSYDSFLKAKRTFQPFTHHHHYHHFEYPRYTEPSRSIITKEKAELRAPLSKPRELLELCEKTKKPEARLTEEDELKLKKSHSCDSIQRNEKIIVSHLEKSFDKKINIEDEVKRSKQKKMTENVYLNLHISLQEPIKTTFDLKINKNSKLKDVKTKIVDYLKEKHTKYFKKINSNSFILMKKYSLLKDSNTLSESDLKDGDMIHILLKENFSVFNQGSMEESSKESSRKTSTFKESPSRKESRAEKKVKKNVNELAPIDKVPILTKPGYKTKPDFREICRMSLDELENVENFTIFNDYGKIEFEGLTNLTQLNLDHIITIEESKILVYQNDDVDFKPRQGQGLNKPAIVTIKKCFPPKKEGQEISQDQKNKFLTTLTKICKDKNAEYMNYDEVTGDWTFRVEHFV